MGAIKYIRVAIAEAEHLLHEAHSPKEIVLGFAEDVLKALATGTLPDVPPPPVSTTAPVVAAAPTNDPRIDAIAAAVAAQQAQLAQMLALMGAPPVAAAPAPPPPAPAPEQLPLAGPPVTTEAPTVFPVPVSKTT